MLLFVAMNRWLFRSALVHRPERVSQLMALVTAAFALHGVLHVEPSVVALLGAGLLVLVARREVQPFLAESSGRPWRSSWACSSWSEP